MLVVYDVYAVFGHPHTPGGKKQLKVPNMTSAALTNLDLALPAVPVRDLSPDYLAELKTSSSDRSGYNARVERE